MADTKVKHVWSWSSLENSWSLVGESHAISAMAMINMMTLPQLTRVMTGEPIDDIVHPYHMLPFQDGDTVWFDDENQWSISRKPNSVRKSSSNGRCTACQSPATVLFVSCECTNERCKFYKQPDRSVSL